MTTLRARPGVELSSAAVEYPPTGGTYELSDELAAGGGTVTVTNEGLLAVLAALTCDVFATPLLVELGLLNDDFETRFADRVHRRRR